MIRGQVRQKLALLLIVIHMSACTTIPAVNDTWISSNCGNLPLFDAEEIDYSNCVLTGSNWTYTCSYDDSSSKSKYLELTGQMALGLRVSLKMGKSGVA